MLDKTGTVTEGHPVVTALIPVEGWDEQQLLQMAASIEAGSEHPLAEAIVEAANAQSLRILIASETVAVPHSSFVHPIIIHLSHC